MMLVVTIVMARMTRNEEAQICLADSSSHMKMEQDAIAAKISKMRPIRLATLGLAAVMTAVVVGYYAFDVLKQFGL